MKENAKNLRGSPPTRLASALASWLALALGLAWLGLACSGKGGAPGSDASDATDSATAAGGSGAGGAAPSGSAGGSPGSGGAAPGGEGGRSGSGGAAPSADAGTDAAGPDLGRCPIRNCVQRLNALQAGCAAFGASCVKEVHGSQTNYCLANGVRVYLDGDGVTGLATMIRPDGHTCYTIYLTYSAGGPTTGAIQDPDGNTIMLESDSSDGKTMTFSCNGTQWVEDGVSCGAGGINAFPFYFVDCPQTNGQMCLRP